MIGDESLSERGSVKGNCPHETLFLPLSGGSAAAERQNYLFGGTSSLQATLYDLPAIAGCNARRSSRINVSPSRPCF